MVCVTQEARVAQLERSYRLTAAHRAGVACGGDGLFVGETALLERSGEQGSADQWRPRRLADLNSELARCYGLPVELSSRLGGLATVASALNKGDLARAQVAALHLQLPDPPSLAKGARDGDGLVVVGQPLVGWEAWAIDAGKLGTESGKSDDEWAAPRTDNSNPSVATVRTITAEARFYEGITMQDLRAKYGFVDNGSGFSGEAASTKIDPHLPLENATPPLKRTRTFVKW
jgi:hypothetical protein